MASTFFIVALLCISSVLTAVPQYPAYLLPEHRTQLRPLNALEDVPVPVLDGYEYKLIPAEDYAIAEYDSAVESSIFDFLPSPINAVANVAKSVVSGVFGLVSKVASKALLFGKWIIVNGGLVFLGMALVIGFCAFTPFCTLIIEKPFAREIRALNIPYLDDVEYYLNEAYNKYQAMQKSM